MQTIEQRAKSYVNGCELQGKEARKADMVCWGVLETRNLPHAIARLKSDFKVEPIEKYYGNNESRAE